MIYNSLKCISKVPDIVGNVIPVFRISAPTGLQCRLWPKTDQNCLKLTTIVFYLQ